MPWLARLLSFGPETTSSGWSLAVFITSFLGMGSSSSPSSSLASGRPRRCRLGLTMRQLLTTLLRNTPLLMVLLGSVLGFGRFIVQAGGAVFVVIAYGDEGTFTLVGAAYHRGMVLSSFLTPLLLRHLAGRTLIVGSSVIAAALYVGMFLVGFANLGAILVFIFLTGLTLGIFLVTQATMIADSVDDAERRLGVRNDGISFASLDLRREDHERIGRARVPGAFVVMAGYEAGVTVTHRDAGHRLRVDHAGARRQLPALGDSVPVLSARTPPARRPESGSSAGSGTIMSPDRVGHQRELLEPRAVEARPTVAVVHERDRRWSG